MMKSSPTSRHLVVVDDRLIRKRCLEISDRLLKKLGRLEQSLRAFAGEDERSYQSWSAETFPDLHDEITRLTTERERLLDLRYQVDVVRWQFDVDVRGARRIIEQEESDRASDDEELRRAADRRREERERFVRDEEEKRREDRRDRGPDSDDPQGAWDFDTAYSPQRLRYLFAVSRRANRFLFFALRSHPPAVFLKIWAAAPDDVRRSFARAFRRRSTYEFDEVLERMRAGSPRTRVTTPTDSEYVRLIYRQLVLKLHPDRRARDEPWMDESWLEVQRAHDAADLPRLQRLRAQIALRMNDLDQLTVDEILASQTWIERELKKADARARPLRRRPAWRFSARRNFDPVYRRTRRDLIAERDRLSWELTDLRLDVGLPAEDD